jgi:succinate-acetate transporter protein
MTPESRIMLRPLGNPLPLGFLALAAGTLLVSGLQLE